MGTYGQDWAGYQSPAPDTTGLSFVFVKATEGLTYINPRYAAQVAHARLYKLVLGHYHYPHMANDPTAEADRFLSVVTEQPGDLLCLDWEGYDAANKKVPRATQVAYKNAFLARLQAARPTYQVGTYANKAYLDFDPKGPYGDFFWIATAGLPAGKPGISRDWLFHQYGASGVDKDYCPLSAAALKAWAHAKEDDMPLTQDEINKIAAAVWAKPMVSPTSKASHSAETFLRYGDQHFAAVMQQLGASGPAAIDYTKLAAALIAQLKS